MEVAGRVGGEPSTSNKGIAIVTKGITTSNKKLLGTKGIATRARTPLVAPGGRLYFPICVLWDRERQLVKYSVLAGLDPPMSS